MKHGGVRNHLFMSQRTAWIFICCALCDMNSLASGHNGTTSFDDRVSDEQQLPRFALCLSGGSRTLQHTAARYTQLLASNPGTDVFVYLGLDQEVCWHDPTHE